MDTLFWTLYGTGSDGKVQNQGMLLRVVGGSGTLVFGSREQTDAANRPQLTLTCDKGSHSLAPQADTFLDRSTYRSLGRLDQLKISSDPLHTLLRFDLRGTEQVGKLRSAILRLNNLARYGGPSLTVGVFRCVPGQDVPSDEPTLGLAAKYPGDRGISNDPAVVFFADMAGDYGDIWVWQRGYRGFLEKNPWYSIEQYLKLNTPGATDGILRAWVDGRLAFAKTDLRFRTVDPLKIEQIWMNVYHGGKSSSPYDQHLFIDNVVIAREYIGPMN